MVLYNILVRCTINPKVSCAQIFAEKQFGQPTNKVQSTEIFVKKIRTNPYTKVQSTEILNNSALLKDFKQY